MTAEDPHNAARQSDSGDLEHRLAALSPKRLGLLICGFIAALALLLFLQMREENNSRRTETALRLEAAAASCSARVEIALVANADLQTTLAECHPGGAAAAYYLDNDSAIVASYGASKAVRLDSDVARRLGLDSSGSATLTIEHSKIAAFWRPIDGGAVAVIGPRDDLFSRTPVWAGYALILAAITIVIGALMAAFMRQSRVAGDAARAVGVLRDLSSALAAGRASPWRFDAVTRSVSFTRALLEPLGLGARDRIFSLREISALAHPEDLRTALAIFTGEPDGLSEGPVRFRDPAGAWSKLYLRTSAQRQPTSRSGVAFDLSPARSQAPAIQLAESRLKDAIECIPEAFVLWDGNGRLAVWNRRFAALFRLADKGLAPGLTATEVAARSGDKADLIKRYFAPDSAQGSPSGDQSVECGLEGDRWIHISRRRTAEGGVVCIATNVTDLKRRARAQKKKERELQHLVADLETSRGELSETMRKYQLEKHRAEEANRSKSEFLAKMSHELRTPLNAINGFSEIMQAELYGPLGDAKYKEYVDDILGSGRHLLELIDDILDMSKIETGRIELEPKRVDLEKLVKECARLVAKKAQDAGVALTVSLGAAPAIFADARAAKQVTLNLLSNAIKFTPKGGAVTVTAEADLDGVTLIIADEGSGIEKGQLARLGAPFERSRESQVAARQGSGIGLALSKALMELMGGILAIASEPGKGTVACAAFPRRPDAKVRLPQFLRHGAHVLTGARPAAAQDARKAAE